MSLSVLTRANKVRVGFFDKISFMVCKQLLVAEATKQFVNADHASSAQKSIAGFMSYEAYQDAVEQAATNIRQFWAELKLESVNVF